MFNSIHHKSTNADCPPSHSYKPIATGVIVHDSNPSSCWLQRLWKSLVHQLLRGHEPHIWQEYGPSGQLIWRAYHPQSQRSAYCYTEAEVRDWLEQCNQPW